MAPRRSYTQVRLRRLELLRQRTQCREVRLDGADGRRVRERRHARAAAAVAFSSRHDVDVDVGHLLARERPVMPRTKGDGGRCAGMAAFPDAPPIGSVEPDFAALGALAEKLQAA